MITIEINDSESDVIITSLKIRMKILKRNYYYQKDDQQRKLIIQQMKETDLLRKKIDYRLIEIATGSIGADY